MSPTDLWTRGDSTYASYRVPGVLVTPAGVVLAHVEARAATRCEDAWSFGKLYKAGDSRISSDWTDNDIVMRRSLDGGATWEPTRVVVSHTLFGPGPCHNFCPIADYQQQCVHALVSYDYKRAFYTRSDDDGLTWSEPREITAVYHTFRARYWWTVLSSGVGHGIQLRSGRLIVPVWISDAPDGLHEPNRCATLYSDDHGTTWHAGELVGDTIPSCNESQAVELSDGSVMLNMRNTDRAFRRAVTVSPDGVREWARPRLEHNLPDPRCMGSITRVAFPDRTSPGLLAFSNCDSEKKKSPDAPEGQARLRQNLTLRLSTDDGQTWPKRHVLEPGYSGYSDLAVLADGRLLCIHERGSDDGIYQVKHISVARVGMDQFEEVDQP